jgi:phosphatidylinositol alpha-1,6-mannosyltransferase
MKKQKILLITNDFYPSRGGIQECIMGLARSFGEKAVVLAPYYSGYEMQKDKEFPFITQRTDGLRQDRVVDKFLFLLLRRPLAFFLQTFAQIYRMQKSGVFTLVICGHLTTIVVGIFAKRLFGAPIGCLIHGKEMFFSGILKPFKKAFSRFLLSNSDYLFLSNSFMEKKLIEGGIPRKKIIKIPFGINIPQSKHAVAKRIKNDQKVILTVGRLVERKGHEVVLEALPAIVERYPNVKYLIIGKGLLERKLKNIVEKRKLCHVVEFHGEVDNIADFYGNCDVFIMPSRFIEKKGDVEGFGLVFLEANFFGKPVIAGNSGGISDAVIDGETGILVNPENPKEIADAVLKLFDDPKLARKLGEQGRKRVLEEFTWDRAAEIIERTMGGGKGSKVVNRGDGEPGKRRGHEGR